MPGQLCSGHAIKNADLVNSKAYCEGRRALYASWPGAAANPHQVDSDARIAWKAGFDSVSDPSDPADPRDCCADPARGQTLVFVPVIVGETEAAAIVILEAANLVPNHGAGSADPVESQSPIAGSEVTIGTTVTYNLAV